MSAGSASSNAAATDGLAASLHWLRRRVLRGATMIRFEVPLERTSDGGSGAAADVVIRSAEAGDAAALARVALGRRTLEQRLAGGEIALLAECGGEPVGCTFIAFAALTLDHYLVSYVPRAGEAYHYGLHVLPAARGGGVAAGLARAAAGAARARGARLLVCDVDAANPAAIAVQRAAGARERERRLVVVIADRRALIAWRRRSRPETGA